MRSWNLENHTRRTCISNTSGEPWATLHVRDRMSHCEGATNNDGRTFHTGPSRRSGTQTLVEFTNAGECCKHYQPTNKSLLSISSTSVEMRPRPLTRAAAKAALAATDAIPSLPEVGYLDNDLARCDEKHVFFWSGTLSNWSRGSKFLGSRCFEIMLPELEKLDVELPSRNTISTRLIQDHSFNCGEQWMMSMKAWLFESDLELASLDTNTITELEYRSLQQEMYRPRAPAEWPERSRERALWNSTLCRILREKTPRVQKEYGRGVRGFRDEIWSIVCIPCVTAACVARAEADPALRKIYLCSGTRQFVEGSPRDMVWGVGLHWKSPNIEDENNWNGENKLGLCHDKAALRIRGMFPQTISTAES